MVEIAIFDSRSIAIMDKIPCTGNDASGNQYRVTGGHGGIRLRKDAQ
jgi:hypothetical protein